MHLSDTPGIIASPEVNIPSAHPAERSEMSGVSRLGLRTRRRAVYTAIFGDYDRLKPHPEVEGTDFICFTDDAALSVPGWDVRVQTPRYASPRLSAKYYKLMPHMVLVEYEQTLWIDGGVKIKTADFVREAMEHLDQCAIAVFRHPERDCIFDEAAFSEGLAAYAGQPLRQQVQHYASHGYQRANGLYACGIIARRGSDTVVRSIGEAWLRENEQWSVQDQLSFPYVLWQHGLKPSVFPYNLWNNHWFDLDPHRQSGINGPQRGPSRLIHEQPLDSKRVGPYCDAGERPSIYGFMHVPAVGDWRRVVSEQLLKVRASGLWERTRRLFVCLQGADLVDFPGNDSKVRLVQLGHAFGTGELPTLATVRDFCDVERCWVYYVHAGCDPTPSAEARRRMHEHFVLLRHEDCMAGLQDHDVCGVDWQPGDRAFGGSFWWATSDYIRTLPDVRMSNTGHGPAPAAGAVGKAWIGGNPRVRAASLYSSGGDIRGCSRSGYARLREVILDESFRQSAFSGLENKFQDLLEPVGPIRLIVEVGVEYGFSLFCFAQAAPSATVLGIDPYGMLPEAEARRIATLGIQGISGTSAAREWVESQLQSRYPNALLFVASGSEAATRLAGVIDVLHIDALHTYKDVAHDFARWEPKVRPGGCVLFHDTTSFPHDVGRFFHDLPGRKAEIKEHYGLGAWYKPERRDA